MKRLLFQAVFLAMGMIMGVYASGDVGLDLMCGALVAVCCAAVGEYASGSWLAMTLIVMLDCGACLVPAWYLMLPIAAFNAASSSAGVDGSRFLQALVPRWLWPAATRLAACARRSPKTTRIVRWPYARRRLPNAHASHVRSMTMSATC